MTSILHFIASLFRQRELNSASPAASVKDDLPPPPPLPPPPNLSCFVKGLIHSMETEPDQWEMRFNGGHYYRKHKTHGTVLWAHNPEPFFQATGDPGITQVEQSALAKAIDRYLEEPVRQKMRRDAMEKRAPFEKLGCPDQS
jgi:hypothetical protein